MPNIYVHVVYPYIFGLMMAKFLLLQLQSNLGGGSIEIDELAKNLEIEIDELAKKNQMNA
jgi:hypothetical protein